MTTQASKHFRILALAPTARGVGFAILEDGDSLVDWGVKTVKGREKNAQSMKQVRKLIAQYQPTMLVLEDTKDIQRARRIVKLHEQIIALAKVKQVNLKIFSRTQVMRAHFPEGNGTKHDLAEIIAQRFPEELASRLPPKRKPWTSEDARMGIFEAVALTLIVNK